MPLFSVIIPTYNRKDLVAKAVSSVLAQTLKDFEMIVVDDGSSDGTAERLEEFGSSLRFIRQDHAGVSAARNRGIRASGGKHILFLDSDDLWLPEKLAAHRDFITENPSVLIHQCDETWIRRGRRVNPKMRHRKISGNIFRESLELCLISPSAVCIDRRIFGRYGDFDENLPACEDYDLWLRITAGETIGLIDRPLVVRHGGHEDQLSSRHWGMDRFRAYSILKLLATGAVGPVGEKAEHAAAVLMRKLEILMNGAVKRGNGEFAEAVGSIIPMVRDGCYSSIDYRTLLEG